MLRLAKIGATGLSIKENPMIRVDEAYDAFIRLMRGYYDSDRDLENDVQLIKDYFNQELKKEGLM